MRIGIIGPGRVGTALGSAFEKAGYKITGIGARDKKDAVQCMKATGCKYWSSEPQDIINVSDIVLITVPDSEIKNVVAKITPNPNITAKAGSRYGGTILVHTSGSLPASILNAKHNVSIHPIASFAVPLKRDSRELAKGTYFGIEGDVKIGGKLVRSIGGIPIVISPKEKALYHSALNFGASYLLTLLHKGKELLSSNGIENAEEIILSLAESTLRNAKKYGIKRAFTGPIERKDTEIVKAELNAIKKTCPENLELYKLLIKETRKILM